jgi:alkanesulfonate monooxygenase SsuD/methylene tetrahydromethanopterin reductase-like flavin-dependent oxidoreductase (luciferase family)
MADRGRRFDEWLDCLDRLLTEDPVSFEGERYVVPRSHSLPLPVQRPRPPLLIGGSAERALRRAGSKGDGWVSSSRASLDDIRNGVVVVRDAAEAAGKARDAVRCVVRGVTVVRDTAGEAPLSGPPERIRDDLARFEELDVDEVFLDLNFDSEEVGNPAADPARALAKAHAVLEACAPDR